MCERCLATDVRVGDELFFGGGLEPVLVVSTMDTSCGKTYWLETADEGRAIMVRGTDLLYATNRCERYLMTAAVDSLIGKPVCIIEREVEFISTYNELLSVYPRPGEWVLRRGTDVVLLTIEDIESIDTHWEQIYVRDGWLASNSDS